MTTTTMREPLIWKFRSVKARYYLMLLVPIFFVSQLIDHDVNLYYHLEHGDQPVNFADKPFIHFQNHAQALLVDRVIGGVMVTLVVLAILSRLAQRHYNSHGVSV